jgi:hypothetical protein
VAAVAGAAVQEHHPAGTLILERAYQLLARATDRQGAQPATMPFNDGGYQFWAVVRDPVTAM